MELDLTRLEWSVSRTFDDSWDAVFRLPYLIKDQTAITLFSDSVGENDRAAARRNGRIHHRTETYSGFSDAELSVGWRRKDLLVEDSVFRVSAGITLPFGDTEANPWVLGDAGLEHLHIQFGNGTVDPVIDCYFGLPLAKHWAVSLFTRGRFPLYENGEGYRGSLEATAIPRLTWLPTPKFSLSAGLSADYFGYSYWSGKRDENSGQFTLNATVGAGVKITDALTASVSALFPVVTQSFSEEDSLDPAPAFSVSLGFQF
ncbi:MAG: hypothetical protein KA004_06680 [Verrucomicrobiales bacterium]|nr:hypothetical protein [Verrucomicrobiales bacterium]